MNLWIEENRLKTEGGILAAPIAAVLLTEPAWCWSMATAHPLAFGISLTTFAFAWVARWEIREEHIQDWLDKYLIRWFVPMDSSGSTAAEGWWEYAPKGQKRPGPTATETYEKWLAENSHLLEEMA